MTDLFNLSPNSQFGANNTQLKSNAQILMTNNNIEQRQSNDPLLKTTYPIYLYKPPFGYPRNVNVVFLRNLANNPYVFSVIKAITDQAAETKWAIKPKEGVEMNEQLEQSQKYNTEFFKNPNSDNESFAQLLRKIIPDILTLDSGVFNKVYNRKGELLQLRVIDGGAILKNPDRHGSLANRVPIIFEDANSSIDSNATERKNKAYNEAVNQYNSYGYTDQAAYFQFAYGINYSVPIPFGRKEIIYIMENPSTETVYSRISALQSAIDITLNLIYSSKASLDLFLNANIPSGIIQIAEANQEDTEAFQDKLFNQQYSGFDEYGFQRKINGKLPVVGNPNVSFTPLNFKNSESQLLEIQQWFTKVLWSCFGVTADEMGFTENSNKATGEAQTKANARKAVKPRLSMIANYLNDQVIPELMDGDLFEFVFDEFDIEEEIKKTELYTAQIANGMMSPQMAAEKEGVDLIRLKKDKEENMSFVTPGQDNGSNFNKKDDKKNESKTEVKSQLKSELRMVYTSSRVDDHIHTGMDGEENSSYDDDHDHPIDWENGLLLSSGKTPHTHRLMDFDKYVLNREDITETDEDEDEVETIPDAIDEGMEDQADIEQEVTDSEEFKSNGSKPPKKSALEVTMSEYDKEFERLVKEAISKV